MPDQLRELIVSGGIVDLILIVLILEAVMLLIYRRLRGRGIAYADLISNAAAGACLLLALRAAIAGSGPLWIGVWLAGALAAHLADLRCRWRAN